MFKRDGIGGGDSTDHHQLFNRVSRPVDEQSFFYLNKLDARCCKVFVLFSCSCGVFPNFIFLFSHEQIYA